MSKLKHIMLIPIAVVGWWIVAIKEAEANSTPLYFSE